MSAAWTAFDVLAFGHGFLIGSMLGLLAIDFGGRELLAITERIEKWVGPQARG